MGGTEDLLISVNEFKQTAYKYGAELVLVEGASHDLMLGRGCQQALDALHQWLKKIPK
jgi:alpha-beta hydrolase superfamily lysophospholipase